MFAACLIQIIKVKHWFQMNITVITHGTEFFLVLFVAPQAHVLLN